MPLKKKEPLRKDDPSEAVLPYLGYFIVLYFFFDQANTIGYQQFLQVLNLCH